MINVFKAIELSFEQYSQKIIEYMSQSFTNFGQKYNNSTVIGQIITVISSTVQNIMLYIEDAFVEQNKFTATRKKSIYGLAQISGYSPSLGKSAGVQLKLTWKASNISAFDIVLTNHTPVICRQNGLTYQILLPQESITMNVEKDNTYRYVYAIEGSFESQSFVSEGGPTYLKHIDFDGDIDESYITVTVNGETWENAASLYDMEPDGKQWFYKPSILGGIIIGFGNNVHGRALNNGDSINVSYLRHSGEYGNLSIYEDINFMFVGTLNNLKGEAIDPNEVLNISLANKDTITSGTFSESSDQVKQMIGYNSRAMVLAAPENYKAYLNKFSFVGYNRTWSETGSLVVNSLVMKNYRENIKNGQDYFSLTEKDFFLSNEQKKSIISNIVNSGRQLSGVTYNIFDPELCKYSLYIYVKPLSGVDYASLETNIKTAVGGFFANITQDDYVPKSDIIQYIKNSVSGIDGINCYFLSERNETALIEKQYTDKSFTYNPSKGTYDVHEETVHLYDGEDPGLGLDAHGNILLENNEQFPVLMGGWYYKSKYKNSTSLVRAEPIIISFE